ncbi:MAG: aldehyde dehydrogenase (NADP(+)) [Candidatus Sumerlaeia bacterium]|nr:aldehyde dehydrogenase (NADP(+)) [Candidatus Sumerlaeia bacterium]
MTNTELKTENLIAGEYTSGTGTPFHSVNPATGEDLSGDFRNAAEADVNRAMEGAAEAARRLRSIPPSERAGFLRTIAEEIEALGDTLVERATAETGLPAGRIQGERGRTCGQLRLFASVIEEGSWVDARIDRAIPDRQPLPKPDIRRMLMPLGPVVVFAASNFPLAFSTAGGDTASALAAGCPVVVKAHRAHPGTSSLVAGAIHRAAIRTSMPAGIFSHLHGPGSVIGIALVKHPLTEAVGFTGSRHAGMILHQTAAARPKPIPVFAEMGSINPVFLLGNTLAGDPQGLAAAYCQSVNLGVGQFCTNPGLLVAPQGSHLDAFEREAAKLFNETPKGTMLTGAIAKSYHEGLRDLEKSGVVRRLSNDGECEGAHACSALLATTAENFLKTELLHEEVFGPSSLIVSCRDRGEMMAVGEHLEGQLTATIHGTDKDLAEHCDLVDTLSTRVGRIIFNGWPTGVEVCPSMNHGGPFPASTDPRYTSVGTAAILRFARPISYQNWPSSALPPALRDENKGGITRMVDGVLTRD